VRWRAEDTSEVHREKKHAVTKQLLFHSGTCREPQSMNTAGVPAANLVAEAVLVEAETLAAIVGASLVVH